MSEQLTAETSQQEEETSINTGGGTRHSVHVRRTRTKKKSQGQEKIYTEKEIEAAGGKTTRRHQRRRRKETKYLYKIPEGSLIISVAFNREFKSV